MDGMFVQPGRLDTSAAKKAKALSRLERIKARAIKSANKVLGGVNEDELAKTMGLESYPKRSKAPPRNGSLASALGMSLDPSPEAPAVVRDAAQEQLIQETANKTLFQAASEIAAAKISSPSPSISSRNSKKNKPSKAFKYGRRRSSQQERALGAVFASPQIERLPMTPNVSTASSQKRFAPLTPRSMSSNRTYETESLSDSCPSEEQQLQDDPQAGSLAEALGIKVDRSESAPPIRQLHEENEEDSVDVPFCQVYDRPKTGTLAEALGYKVPQQEQSPNTKPKSMMDAILNNVTCLSRVGRPNDGSLAAALGMRIDSAPDALPIRGGTIDLLHNHLETALHVLKEEEEDSDAPRPGSLAQALGMRVATTSSSPRVGSLADALNMSIDPSYDAPAIREGAFSLNKQPRPGSLAAALGMTTDMAPNASPIRVMDTATPATVTSLAALGARAGSLADALGIAIDSSYDAPAIRASDQPKPGSLAAALGMAIDFAANSPPIRVRETHDISQELLDEMGPRIGSLADALGMAIDFSKNAAAIRLSDQPRQGSLAAALGMAIDFAPHSPPIRVRDEASINTSTGARVGSLADALGMAIDPSNDAPAIRASHSPKPGSLAAALGMAIDASPGSPPIRRRQDAQPLGARAGSLADALGITIDFSQDAPAIRASNQPKPGSLAAALGMAIDASPDSPPVRFRDVVESSSSMQQPRAGSLAEALGMLVGPQDGVIAPPPQSRRRSFLDAVLTSMPRGEAVAQPHKTKKSLFDAILTNMAESETDANGLARPRAGSLADAVGMKIDTSRLAPFVRRQQPLRTSLTDMVLERLQEWDHDNDDASSYSSRDSSVNDYNRNASNQRLNVSDIFPASAARARVPQEIFAASEEHSQAFSAVTVNHRSLFSAILNRMEIATDDDLGPHIARPAEGSLAEALGMSIDESYNAPPVRTVDATPGQLHKNTSHTGDTSIDGDVTVVSMPHAGSLASALGMVVDASPRAPPIRQQQHIDAMSRLERIKAKAIRSVKREYGVDVSEALSVDANDVVVANPGRKQKQAAPAQEMDIDYLAKALGVPSNFLNLGAPKPKFEDLEVSSSSSSDDDDEDDDSVESAPKDSVIDPPCEGSLAFALGMSVDPNLHAPAVREVAAPANIIKESARAAKSFESKERMFEAVMTTSSANVPPVEYGAAAEGMRSLASALGLKEQTSDSDSDSSDGDSSYSSDDYSTGSESSEANSVDRNEGHEEEVVKVGEPRKDEKSLDGKDIDYLANALGLPSSFFYTGQSGQLKNDSESADKPTPSSDDPVAPVETAAQTDSKTLAWLKTELLDKTERIDVLELELQEERKARELLSAHWAAAESRLNHAMSQVNVLRQDLSQEISEVKALKAELREEREAAKRANSTPSPTSTSSSSPSSSFQSPVMANMQRKMLAEEERRKLLSARVKKNARAREKSGIRSPEGRSLDHLKERLGEIRNRLHYGISES